MRSSPAGSPRKSTTPSPPAVGGLFYFVAWLVVGGYGGAFTRAPGLSWTLAAAFLALGLARWVHRRHAMPMPPAPALGVQHVGDGDA
jgi:hypothetical protein